MPFQIAKLNWTAIIINSSSDHTKKNIEYSIYELIQQAES